MDHSIYQTVLKIERTYYDIEGDEKALSVNNCARSRIRSTAQTLSARSRAAQPLSPDTSPAFSGMRPSSLTAGPFRSSPASFRRCARPAMHLRRMPCSQLHRARCSTCQSSTRSSARSARHMARPSSSCSSCSGKRGAQLRVPRRASTNPSCPSRRSNLLVASLREKLTNDVVTKATGKPLDEHFHDSDFMRTVVVVVHKYGADRCGRLVALSWF